MNFPTKDDAKALARKHGLDGVIIVALRADESDFCVTSYGRDRGFCDLMARLGQVVSDVILAWTEKVVDRMAPMPDEAMEEREEEARLREVMADLLTRTANALKGEPPELTRHSWHDLPDVAKRIVDRTGDIDG